MAVLDDSIVAVVEIVVVVTVADVIIVPVDSAAVDLMLLTVPVVLIARVVVPVGLTVGNRVVEEVPTA